MRSACWSLLAAFVLALANVGCAREVIPALHEHGRAALRPAPHGAVASARAPIKPTAIADSAQPIEINLPALARDVDTVPAELDALRRLLRYAALGVLVCGALNAVLLFCILLALQRRTTVAIAEVPGSAIVQTPRCGCGTPISPRSRTGRCRRCALAHRRTDAAARTAVPSSSAHAVEQRAPARELVADLLAAHPRLEQHRAGAQQH